MAVAEFGELGSVQQAIQISNDSMELQFLPGNISNFSVTLDLKFDSPPQDPGSYALNGICIPFIGLCGVLGNVLNLAVLSRRYTQREVDVLERCALLGLIGLSVSDLCFCLTILPHALYHRPKTLFGYKGLHFLYRVYGIYLQNVFIKTSTCLTVVIATARYIGICHPLRARIFVGSTATKVAVIGTFVLWAALCLPLVWTYSITIIPISNTTNVYLLDLGALPVNKVMHQVFTYIWASLGYFLPMALLTYCNINLIRALRRSRKLRQMSAHTHAPSGKDTNARITLTLIVLILMFTVLVSPSEVLHFYSELVVRGSYRTFEVAMHVTNILQALNFAFHFVLYCAVNVTFRRTLICAFYHTLRKLGLTQKPPPNFTAMSRKNLSGTGSNVLYNKNAERSSGTTRATYV